MEEAFNEANPSYKNHHKIFFFGDTGGATDRKTGAVSKFGR